MWQITHTQNLRYEPWRGHVHLPIPLNNGWTRSQAGPRPTLPCTHQPLTQEVFPGPMPSNGGLTTRTRCRKNKAGGHEAPVWGQRPREEPTDRSSWRLRWKQHLLGETAVISRFSDAACCIFFQYYQTLVLTVELTECLQNWSQTSSKSHGWNPKQVPADNSQQAAELALHSSSIAAVHKPISGIFLFKQMNGNTEICFKNPGIFRKSILRLKEPNICGCLSWCVFISTYGKFAPCWPSASTNY